MANRGDQNSSVRNTKKRIREGFLKLLETKPINKISISELTAAIDISRGTFYAHYEDIYDLSNQLENEILDQLQVILDEIPQRDTHRIIQNIFLMLQDNVNFAQIFLTKEGHISFIEKIRKLAANNLTAVLMDTSHSGSPIEYEYFNSFLIFGFIGIVQSWLNSGLQKSPSAMADFTSSFIRNAVVAFYAQSEIS